jgi:predicted RNase H-like HicB family nuclease
MVISIDNIVVYCPHERRDRAMRQFKVIVEQHPDGYIAYPLRFKGAVVGEGETAAEAVADVTSAIRFSLETFGRDALEDDLPVIDAFITEVSVVADA